MREPILPLEPRETEPVARKPWQPLGFDKVAAADAEAAVIPPPGNFDGTGYS